VETGGKSIRQVALELGIPDSTLSRWCKLSAEQGAQAFSEHKQQPNQGRATPEKSSITRSGTRRLGDDYQDLVAVELLLDWLEHNDRYDWVAVEADGAGVLDDVTARKQDGTMVYRQVKYSVHPDEPKDPWSWEILLEQEKGKKEQPLPSLLQDWATSLEHIIKTSQKIEASLWSNRQATGEFRDVLVLDGGTKVDYARLSTSTHSTIIAQLGDDEQAKNFFQNFRFFVNQPNLVELDEGLWRRFARLGGTHEGWLALKAEVRSWVAHRYEPPPDGYIRLSDIRRAAGWYELKGLPQEFSIPDDYVPPQAFLHDFAREVLTLQSGSVVLSGSPGVGKSTFISYLYKHLRQSKIPAVRHHYYLAATDRTSGFRLDHLRAAESLMHDLARDHADALGSLADRNPKHDDLPTWLEACGNYYASQGKALILLLDGLDHIWREQHSIDELARLLNYILPLPVGVVLVCATQPVDDDQLPPSLLRAAPRRQWKELPLLDEPAINQWVHKHIAEFSELKNLPNVDMVAERLASALYNKGHGHPLYLRYTIKALHERRLAFTEETIANLPGCPHEGITAYYEELWRALPQEGREVLHLLAATGFPWRREGIIACMDTQGQQMAQLRSALREINHLLVAGDLGLHPFHSSVFVFITELREHRESQNIYLERALVWLRQGAPEYWRWAHTWLIEAQLGDDTHLRQSPNRQWVIDALVARRPTGDVLNLLHRSMEAEAHHGDLLHLVELGLLNNYFGITHEFQQPVREQLLYSQLILSDHADFVPWLFAELEEMTDGELVIVAEQMRAKGDLQRFKQCSSLLEYRRQYGRHYLGAGSYPSWQQQNAPHLAMLAMRPEVNGIDRVVDFAVANRKQGFSREILALYCEYLRTWHNIDHFRTLLQLPLLGGQEHLVPEESRALTFEEAQISRRNAVLLALEEDLEIDELRAHHIGEDPFAAIYAAMRNWAEFQPSGTYLLPESKMMNLRHHEAFNQPFSLRELCYQTFFTFLAHHLYGMEDTNQTWIKGQKAETWIVRFLSKLNSYAASFAAALRNHAPVTFETFFKHLDAIEPPAFEDDERAAREYYKAAHQAAVTIGLDLFTLTATTGGATKISQAELSQALTSAYCRIDDLLQQTIARRRIIFAEDAVQWLIDAQMASLQTTVSPCNERAELYASLAAVAALHGKTDLASRCVAQSAEHLLAHGYHKDMLFYHVLDAIQHYAKNPAGPDKAPEVLWTWLAKLAPAIDSILGYTDGDETRHFPAALADALALVAPDKLLAYYQWQCQRGTHGLALSVLHAFLDVGDLANPLARALAMTAIDQRSLHIIARRAAEGDPGAQSIQVQQQSYLGEKVFAESDPTQSPVLEDITTFDPQTYPPEQFMEMLQEHPGKERIAAWIEHWRKQNRNAEVYQALVKADKRGIDIECYDQLFVLTRALYGKDAAYPWLIKAHIQAHGWYWYVSYQNEAEQRWRWVKQYYPGYWQDFLRQTLIKAPAWSTASFSHGDFRRLIEYCLFMNQQDFACQLLDQMVNQSLELVSMLHLPKPEWLDN
jgi:hypothetical protein